MTLSNALLGFEPVLDSNRDTIATRLSIVAANSARPLSAAQCYTELAQLWPEDAGVLIIDMIDTPSDDALLTVSPTQNCWLGLPVESVGSSDGADRFQKLKEMGFKQTLCGSLISRLPDEISSVLEMTIVPSGTSAEKPFACDGVDTMSRANQAFDAGACAAIGWPLVDLSSKPDKASGNSSFEIIGRLVALANANADSSELEPVFRLDPSLSFRLLRYLNSAAFGLRVEVQSIQHAVMMIGMQRLKKWLALLLATAAQDPDLKPLMFASLRRGFMLEGLIGDVIGPQAKDEAFILGVFSLLDKLFGESFESLFSRLQIPESVHDALVGQTGQYLPYLGLVKVLEGRPGQATEDALTNSFVERADCNAALVKALGEASVTENQ